MGPHVVFLLYLLNSLFLGAEIFRLFLKFYGESFGIQFELVRQKSPDKVGNSYCFTDTYLLFYRSFENSLDNLLCKLVACL